MHIKSTLLLSTLLVTTAVSAPLMAASTNGFYLGGGFGYTMLNQDGDFWNLLDFTGSGAKLYGGYLWPMHSNLGLGLDIDWGYLGNFSGTTSGPWAGDIQVDDGFYYFAFNAAASYLLNDNLSVMGRIGVQTEHDNWGTANSNLLLGIQGNYSFTPNWSGYLSLDYLNGDKLDDIDDNSAIQATSFGLGVQYNFS